MKALLHKELQEMIPLLLAILLGSLVWIGAHVTQPLAVMSIHEVLDYLIEDWAFFVGMMAFLVGHSRIGPEFTLQTMTFLDGLPISRHRIFFSKVLAGLLPVGLMVLVTFVVKMWALSLWVGDGGASMWGLAGWATLHISAFIIAFLGAGFLMSWFGSLGWAALIVCLLAMLLVSFANPSLRWLFPFGHGVFDLVWQDDGPLLRPLPLVIWAASGGLGILLSYAMLLGPGERLIKARSMVSMVFQVLIFAIPCLLIMVVGGIAGLHVGLRFSDFLGGTERKSSEHFRFLWNKKKPGNVFDIMPEAESIRQAVATEYGIDGPSRIDVEMTGQAVHFEGLALEGKIKLSPNASLRTFTHELSHSFSQHLRPRFQADDSWRFFEEGLAEWVAAKVQVDLSPKAGQKNMTQWKDWISFDEAMELSRQRQGYVIWKSEQADWMHLFSDRKRRALYDPDQVYILGALWAEAVADSSHHSPTCIVKMADKVAPKFDGAPRWYQMIAGCGGELAEVIDNYEQSFSAVPFIEGIQLPEEVRSNQSLRDGTIIVDGDYLRVAGEQFTACRFRDEPHDARETYDTSPIRKGRCKIHLTSGRSFEVQLRARYTDEPEYRGEDSIKVPVYFPWHKVVLTGQQVKATNDDD